jgi:predicted dehydrogenase
MVAPALHAAAGAELYAVAARDRSRAGALNPTGPVYGSYAELLADAVVDAVYISLHNSVHVEWTLAALEAGKHVLCEKPLGLTTAEIDAMREASQRCGRLAVEALMYRWHPRARLAEQLLRDGRIGSVRHVAAGFTFGGVAADNYRLDTTLGGGALYDIGCYPVSAALMAFGDAAVQDVVARIEVGPTGVDLAADLLIQFADGEAEIHVGMNEPERQWAIVSGDAGEIELSRPAYTAWLGSGAELLVSDGRGTERIVITDTDAYRVILEDVSAAIRGEDAYVVPLSDSRAVAAVIDAAFVSARSNGEPVAPG